MSRNIQTFNVDTQLLQKMVDSGYARNIEDALQRAIVLYEFLSDYREQDGSLHVLRTVSGNPQRKETAIQAFVRAK